MSPENNRKTENKEAILANSLPDFFGLLETWLQSTPHLLPQSPINFQFEGEQDWSFAPNRSPFLRPGLHAEQKLSIKTEAQLWKEMLVVPGRVPTEQETFQLEGDFELLSVLGRALTATPDSTLSIRGRAVE